MTRMKFNVLTLCITVATSLQFGYAQEQISVQEAVARALENNLQVKQAAFQHLLTEQELHRAKMEYLPTLNVGINGRRNWGLFFNTDVGALSTQAVSNLGGGLSSNVSLFQGFRRVHQIAANRHQLMADATDIERTKSDLKLAVVTKYLEAIVNRDMWDASQQQLRLSQEQLRVSQINLDAGTATVADLSQAKSQVATDELNLVSNQNAYELAVLELKQLMEMAPGADIELVAPDVSGVITGVEVLQNGGELYEEAVRIYPAVRVAEERSRVAERNIAVAKSAYYPSLDIGGNLNTAYSSGIPDIELALPLMSFERQMSRNFAQAVFFNLNIPIFNRLEARTNVSRAKINYQNVLTNEQLAKNNLNKLVHQAVMDLRSAQKKYSSTNMAFQSAKDAFDAIRQRFEVGMANSVELSTSQTTMNNAEFAYIQATYDLIFKEKIIDFYLGKDISF